MGAVAYKLKLENVVSLGIGEPDFITPWHIRDGGIYSLEKGITAYTPNKGLPDLQKAVAAYLGRRFDLEYAADEVLITVGGSEAIDLAVRALVEAGDEVIVPAYTYIATAMAVVAAGAMPVIAEVDETLTLCPVDTEKKITPHTKAIIPVHIQGFPCKMDAFMDLANKYGLYVLEDACQADGGSYQGRRLARGATQAR